MKSECKPCRATSYSCRQNRACVTVVPVFGQQSPPWGRPVIARDAAARELKTRTLTNLYNPRPAWLDHAHKTLDEALAEAYGRGDDWRAGKLTDDEILARLFKLNQDRPAAQTGGS